MLIKNPLSGVIPCLYVIPAFVILDVDNDSFTNYIISNQVDTLRKSSTQPLSLNATNLSITTFNPHNCSENVANSIAYGTVPEL